MLWESHRGIRKTSLSEIGEDEEVAKEVKPRKEAAARHETAKCRTERTSII
jgi:hypothetical protein